MFQHSHGTFLKQRGLHAAPKSHNARMTYKIGFIGMIKEALEADLWGALTQMATLGYQGVEGDVIVGDSPAATRENRQRLADLGMESVGLACSHYKEETLPQVIENAHLIGAPYIVDYWAGPKDNEELDQLAEQLERMAAACETAGLSFIYHNHEHEFIPKFGEKENRRMFDLLFEKTEKLQFELDIAWCHFGGADPITIIRRCGSRIPVLHVKDLADDAARGFFSAVGTGVVDCYGSIEAAAARGTRWMVVEQDRPGRLSPMESATASILNLREVGLHPTR